MPKNRNIVILTGSGISAESGISTFRGGGGLWDGHKIEEVATPEAFMINPKKVQDFYNTRRRQLKGVKPNPAHAALAELEKNWQGEFLLVTQNVDDLHERSGSGSYIENSLLHMHGELKKIRCTNTGEVYFWQEDILPETRCECCSETGTLRPHIVWFGEMPIDMERIYSHLRRCDLFISIGTSGSVYPAAGFVQEVRFRGMAHTVEINLDPSAGHSYFEEKIYGKAGKVLPEFVRKLLEK